MHTKDSTTAESVQVAHRRDRGNLHKGYVKPILILIEPGENLEGGKRPEAPFESGTKAPS